MVALSRTENIALWRTVLRYCLSLGCALLVAIFVGSFTLFFFARLPPLADLTLSLSELSAAWFIVAVVTGLLRSRFDALLVLTILMAMMIALMFGTATDQEAIEDSQALSLVFTLSGSLIGLAGACIGIWLGKRLRGEMV